MPVVSPAPAYAVSTVQTQVTGDSEGGEAQWGLATRKGGGGVPSGVSPPPASPRANWLLLPSQSTAQGAVSRPSEYSPASGSNFLLNVDLGHQFMHLHYLSHPRNYFRFLGANNVFYSQNKQLMFMFRCFGIMLHVVVVRCTSKGFTLLGAHPPFTWLSSNFQFKLSPSSRKTLTSWNLPGIELAYSRCEA